MSKQTQISLDFGPEEQSPASAGDNGTGNDPARHYMAAGGVGVRVKSYKQTPASGGGDLFGSAAAASEQASPPAAPSATPEAEETTAAPVATATEQPLPEQPVSEQIPAVAAEPVKTVVAAEPVVEDAPLPKRKVSSKNTGAKQKSPSPLPPSKRGRKSLKQVSAEADLIEIPVDEVLFSKQYYTMGEVSEMFRVNQSLLRFWESEFDVLQPRKNKKGDRYFRPLDIKNLHLIYHLLRQKKYTIEGAKDFLKKNKKADERFEVIKRLQEIKSFLLEMKAQL
jgi:DNA-binding transcriptional MerR regulator